ncbi:MAG TPA: hypothetical protein VN937_15760 [Blastocatellia bacterium]|nr:hypothetical protein [Blastocatellia bacterium]
MTFGLLFLIFSGMRGPTSRFIAPQETGRRLKESDGDLKIRSLKVTNRTRAFELVDIEEVDDKNIRLTLKNGYEKKITGFQVSVGAGRVQTDLTLGGDETNFILPENTYQEIYAIQHETDARGITILAVVLEDGTTDGDAEAIEEIEYYRLGMKMERKRVLSLLQGVLKTDDSEIVSALSRVENQVSSPSITQDKTLPYQKNRRLYNINFGTSDERMRIAREIHSIIMQRQDTLHVANQSQSFRLRLLELVEYYERIINKL